MKRTEAPGSVGNRFVDRNIELGVEGTQISEVDMNALFDELIHVIEQSGQTPSGENLEQLRDAIMLKAGNVDETVSGVKTFSSIPVLPSSAPTTANQATRKGYVDGLDSANVKLTGDQSISNVKTFAIARMTSDPSNNNDLSRKSYTDGQIATRVPTSRSVTAGNGLSGGGALTADRELSVNQGFNFSFSGNIDFSGRIRPRTNPVLGSQSVGGEGNYTPDRGLYNSSWIDSNSNRGAVSGAGGSGGDGPYAGTASTQVKNNFSTSTTWIYARF